MNGNAEGQPKSLSDYIQSSNYAEVVINDSSDVTDEYGNPVDRIEGVEQGSSPVVGNAPEAAGLPATSSEPTNSDPDGKVAEERQLAEREAEIDRRVQAELANKDQARRAEEARVARQNEEIRFANYLKTVEDPVEQRALLAEFRQKQAVEAARYFKQRADTVEGSVHQTREEAAKNQVILAVAAKEGIPDEYLPLLKRSKTVEEFDEVVADVKRIVGARKQQEAPAQPNPRQQRLDSGVDVAGGVNAGFVPPAAPKERSGDLLGLLKSRDYQMVNAHLEVAN